MASLEEFAKRIRVIGRGIEQNADRLAKRVALIADQVVVLSTPVDTGRARSNWQVGVGSPVRDSIQPYSPGNALGLGEGANAQGAIAQGADAIGKRRPGQDIFITNNLPYIGELNDGTSAQAPAGFVEKAVRAAVAVVPGTRLVD